MRNLLLALMLVGAHCVFSQETPVDKRKDLATLQGRIANSVTGEPLGDVSLMLRALPPGTETVKLSSDADGRFSFEDIEPGSYILSASWRGSQDQVYGARSGGTGGTRLTLSAGQVLENIEFRIAPLGVISGMVVDDGGKPMSGVRVIATGVRFTANGTVITDGAGEFRFPSLAPGSYLLMAIPSEGPRAPTSRGSPGKPDAPEERLAATYYPSAADAAGALPLEVAPGLELSGITIAVRKVPWYHVRGVVVSLSTDISLADVNLWLMPRTPMLVGLLARSSVAGLLVSSGNTPAPDGSFDLRGVEPGSYYLIARRSSERRVSVNFRGDVSGTEVTGLVFLGRIWVDVTGGDVNGVVLRIGEPLQILGTISTEGQDKRDLTGIRIQLRAVDGLLGNASRATLGGDNTFTLTNVSPNKYAMIVSGLPENAYVESIRLGGLEAIDSGLDLTDMQVVPPLEIRISPNGATVEGGVDGDDGKPAPAAWVALIPDPARPESSRLKSTAAKSNGSFSLTGVAPGEYRLYAFEQPQPGSLVDLGFFKPLESKSVKLTVKEGERKQADLTVLKLPEGR
jgi:hypothetical protein